MTTPERLRRRQRIETALVGLLMVVVAASELNENRENNRQDACLTQQVTKLTEALTARSESTGKLNDAVAGVLDSFVDAAAQGDNSDPAPIIDALQEYAKVQAEVKQSRKDNPFPPFPTGKCDESES